MMKSLTFFCFALLGLVHGQNPCCSVPVFETVEEFITGTTMSGRSYEDQGVSFTSVDQGRQMINSYIDQSSAGGRSKYRILQDYTQKTMFVINDQGNCTKQNITTAFQANCVPAGSTKVKSYYYGALSDTLFVDMYRLPANPVQNGYYTVTSNGCIPVSRITFGKMGQGSQINEFSFTNFTLGIKDPGVFDVPIQCAHAQEA